MDFATYANEGAAALEKGDTLAAVLAYTKAIGLRSSSPDFFTHRATALTRLSTKQYAIALVDTEYAVLLARERGNRKKIQAAQQRRVVCLYGLHRYADAAALLKTMKKWRTEDNKRSMGEGMIWEGKVQQQLNKLPENDPARNSTITEFPTRKILPESELSPLLIRQYEAFEAQDFANANIDTMEAVPDPPPSSNQPQATTASTSVSGPKPPTTIRHEWYQNAQTVTLTIYAKAVPKDQVAHAFTDTSLTLSFPHPGAPTGTDFTLTYSPLSNAIDPEQSNCAIMSTKIEIRLHKLVAGVTWKALAASEGEATSNNQGTSTIPPSATVANPSQSTTTHESGPSYPTSSRHGPKDWDKLAADLTSKPKKGAASTNDHSTTDQPTGTASTTPADDAADDSDSSLSGDPVDGFFKKLYAGADADTRRAMMKSFQESGGTALSTDWKDVGGRKVEVVGEGSEGVEGKGKGKGKA